MTSLIDYWENQGSKYNSLINSNVSLDFLTLMNKVQLKDKNITLSGRTKLNTLKNTQKLTGQSKFSLTHTISPLTKYTISNENNKTTLDGNWHLFKSNWHHLSLYSLLNVNTNNSEMSADLKAHLRYHYNKNSLISAGIEDYKQGKGKVPNQISLYALHRYNRPNGFNVSGGLYSGYLIKEGYVNFHKFLFSFQNGRFNSFLSFDLNSADAKEKANKVLEKSISLKIFNTISKQLTIGGDIDCNIKKNTIANRLFANYTLDKNTVLKSKWEDKDKAFTFTLYHSFRDLIKLGLSGKFSAIKTNSKKVTINSKLGMSIEFYESLP